MTDGSEPEKVEVDSEVFEDELQEIRREFGPVRHFSTAEEMKWKKALFLFLRNTKLNYLVIGFFPPRSKLNFYQTI